MKENKLRIIFIAFSENSLGRNILNNMIEEGITPVHVFMASEEAFKKFRKNGIKRYFKRNGLFNTLWRIIYRLTLRKDVKKGSLEILPSTKYSVLDLCSNHKIGMGKFNNINLPEFAQRLKKLSPDLIVLGGAPLIKKVIIDLPTIGVLNSHPAILPEAKGMDVVAQSIIDNVPLGATVFSVDEGIDSGPIIHQKHMTESIVGKNLQEIEAMVEKTAVEAMQESINKIITGNYTFTPQTGTGKVYRALTFKKYKKVKTLLNHKAVSEA